MEWSETIASRCRYSECAEVIFGDWEILWENSTNDYQGSVEIFAKKDSQYAYMEYDYGSCSECDHWEMGGLTDEKIVEEIKSLTIFFTPDQIKIWMWRIHKEKELMDIISKEIECKC